MRFRRWGRATKSVAAAAVLAAALAAPAIDGARLGASTAAATAVFDRPGTYSYVVPEGMNELAVDALGGAGGDVVGGSGGRGGRVEAVLPVTARETLTVIVGGGGGMSPGYGGGFGNGDGGAGYSGGAGGGASTVKRGATRLVVAGGGGGPGDPLFAPRPCGGHGGGAAGPEGFDGCGGYVTANGGQGGTTTAGGARGCFPGETAAGPDGGDGWGGGGGGGGWFGGGGSCMNGTLRSGGGGGGGSSYATPHSLTAPVFSVGAGPGDGTFSDSVVVDGYVRLTATSDVYSPFAIDSNREYPSRDCETAGGQQVVDTTSQGVRTYLYTRVVATRRVDVCWRTEDGSGAGKGGKVVVRVALPDPGVVGTPTVDGAAASCTTTTSPPNQVPGSHPVAAGGVGGVPYAFDAYSDGASTAWACLRVGTGVVNHRVVVPVALADPEGAPIVSWHPDLDTR